MSFYTMDCLPHMDCDEGCCPPPAVADDLMIDPFSAMQPSAPFCLPSNGDEGIRSVPLPGIRCPKCAKDGKEVWVIPGRACGYCGTACV